MCAMLASCADKPIEEGNLHFFEDEERWLQE
jgi:hypothetical protein